MGSSLTKISPSLGILKMQSVNFRVSGLGQANNISFLCEIQKCKDLDEIFSTRGYMPKTGHMGTVVVV